MSLLLHGDCLEHMKTLTDDSIDLIFCDLPYGQTSCKWDCLVDLDEFWKQVMRIKKLNTPIFFTCTTKFGVSLINSAPKKCPFRYDIIWVKSAPTGFLCAKKMPMRKHEMIYVFYEKLPFYDLSSHKHKFLKPNTPMGDKPDMYGRLWDKDGKPYVKEKQHSQYNPPLPTSIVKEDIIEPNEDYDKREKKSRNTIKKEENYGKGYLDKKVNYRKYDAKLGGKGAESHLYDPPLPTSIVKEENNNHIKDGQIYNGGKGMNVLSDGKGHQYDPPLPTTIVKEEHYEDTIYGDVDMIDFSGRNGSSRYDPPLPTTMLEIKSTKGKHSTEKPVALMSWILKYYSKEGDVVLDPTMGSGSTGVACKDMKRNFIGIEMDDDIFEVAYKRLNEDECV